MDFRLAELIIGIDYWALKSLKIRVLAGWYDNPIPTRFLAPIVGLKIRAQATLAAGIDSLKSILGLLKSLKIRALVSHLLFTRRPP